MKNYGIREIEFQDLERSVEVIRQSFETVAKEFCLTKENCPTNGAFIEQDRLFTDKLKGTKMFGLFVEGVQVGFVAVSKKNETIYEMEKLAVLPTYRRLGYGMALIDFTKEYVKSKNGEIVTIGIIDENTTLKQWYSAYAFVEKGTKTFSHLPFTVCFMEIKV